jgi:hypothetical protein
LSSLEEGIIVDGDLSKILDGNFWGKMAYIIGNENQVFSMDDIEHGILRGNRIHPANVRRHQFSAHDPRKKLSVKKFDSRIHFALNCGAKSCPPIAFYTLENLERGLEMAAQNFITNETSINNEARSLELSKLFLYYREDFVMNTSNIDILNAARKALHYLIITTGVPLKRITSIQKDDEVLIR